MITGTLSIFDRMASILFDLGYTYSYVFVQFMVGLNLVCDILDYPINVSTPIDEFVVVTHVYHSYYGLIKHFQTWVVLIILDMLEFSVIQGMTWLSLYHIILSCNAQTVTPAIPRMNEQECKGVSKTNSMRIISFF